MNGELIAVLDYMEKERGIDRETLLQAVESALQQASRKSVASAHELRIAIDRKTCDIRAFATVTVVDRAKALQDEITLPNARRIKPDAQLGETVEMEVTPKDFGRIAAQTAKQTILQTIRKVERSIIFDEYKDRVGDIVSGSVRRFERGDIVIDLGRAESILPNKERIPGEEYQVGDRVRTLVLAVQDNSSSPGVVLSRSHPDFVKRLFTLEVAEIADGTVEIMGVAREAGYRTKMAVVSHDEKVDPVGACVGMRGIRVKNIVRELSGEKIDIVRWSDDVKTYVTNALAPAKLLKVVVDAEQQMVHVTTDADQLSLAIGKRGQNVRLTAKLIGWRIDIQKEEGEISFEEKVAKAVDRLAAIELIGRDKAEKLVQAGYLNIEGILAAEISDLEEIAGFDAPTAKAVYEAAAAAQAAQQTPQTEGE